MHRLHELACIACHMSSNQAAHLGTLCRLASALRLRRSALCLLLVHPLLARALCLLSLTRRSSRLLLLQLGVCCLLLSCWWRRQLRLRLMISALPGLHTRTRLIDVPMISQQTQLVHCNYQVCRKFSGQGRLGLVSRFVAKAVVF